MSDKRRCDAIKEFQERLVLLSHSSQCEYSLRGHKCRAFLHCGETLRLLSHMAGCRNQNCDVPDCNISKFLLRHYGVCVNDTCSVCTLLRAVMSRKRARAGQVFELTKRRRTFSDDSLGDSPDNGSITDAESLQTEVCSPKGTKRQRKDVEKEDDANLAYAHEYSSDSATVSSGSSVDSNTPSSDNKEAASEGYCFFCDHSIASICFTHHHGQKGRSELHESH